MNIQYVKNKKNMMVEKENRFNHYEAQRARKFHQTIPGYEPTPLVQLKNLAGYCGVNNIFIKDESYRFGQNAFKVLGGSYAVAKYIAEKLGMDISELTYEKIISEEVREKIGEITFVTATDGNHGRGIAWTAKLLKQKCVVYMPKGSATERLENIRALGAEASITACNYDDSVRMAAETARKNGWVLIQDTAFEGYEKIPAWIMQGYLTMMAEAVEQMGGIRPTHVFLQAGVGAMAGSMTGFLASYYEAEKPLITIVEPENANCIFETAKAADGKLHYVTGNLDTIMAGLSCGEPCSIGWDMLHQYADYFVSMSDSVAAQGMRILGNPMDDDTRVVSGESGAAGFGLAVELLRREELRQLKKELKMDENSVILCISTEGDTDRENYRRIVWDGLYTI